MFSAVFVLSACASIKDWPGFRKNVEQPKTIGMSPFQRSAAVQSTGYEALGLRRSALSPPVISEHSIPQGSVPRVATQARGVQPERDVELILGDSQYYRSDVTRPGIIGGGMGSGVALNFERASIREVVSVVLGDILKQTYIVEPGVEGEVTINSSDPIPRSSLIPTLESLLQTQGAVLYQDDTGSYRVAARANLKGRGFVPSTSELKPGYNMQVVPLRYIPVAEMQKILEPLAAPDAFVRVDTNRNILVLAGTSSELANLMATIRTFDVDVLSGMSVGLYKVKNVEAQIVAKNLDALFGESGNSPMAGMIKIMPIEHMNSIMIISANPDYLKKMKRWVDRFDKSGPVEGQQLYVYKVQNGDAEHLAGMLSQIFSGKTGSKKPNGTLPSSLAPGLDEATVGETSQEAKAKTLLGGAAGSEGGVSINQNAEVKIVADKANNSLMILSSKGVYEQIQQALRRIDIMPMQVQVEATIMEVTLNESMEHGLQWYLRNNRGTFGGLGLGGLDDGTKPGGFSFTLTGGASGITGVVNALARESDVKVISSPSVLVLDNQTAEIRVGDQQPIYTSSSQSESGQVLIQDVQYKDTGVSLSVTPHVNANGLVKMDISQDITDVGEEDTVTGNRSFLQRKIKSNIAVQSGETIVLGGLIRENKSHSDAGVPVLRNLPIVGNVFKNKSINGKRTELLILITPTAIKDQSDLVRTGTEMRERMKRLMDDDRFIRQLRGEYVE